MSSSALRIVGGPLVAVQPFPAEVKGLVGAVEDEEGKRAMTSIMTRSRYSPAGPPTPGSPLRLLPPPSHFPRFPGPTSLRKGEGHQIHSRSVVGSELGRRGGGGGGGGMKEGSTINHISG